MKYLILLFVSNIAFAHLYLTTSFSSPRLKKDVVTKHHLFLEIPYLIKYEDVRFLFTLKKIEKENILIESEVLKLIDGKFQAVSGSTFKGPLSRPLIIAPKEDNFKLKINFDKINLEIQK